MHHEAGFNAAFRQLPYLFHSDRVDLRVAAFTEIELLDQLFGQRSARAFAEHGHLGEDVGAGLVILLRLAVLADPLVAGAYADDPIVLAVEQLGAGEFGNKHHVRRLGDGAEPADHLVQADDVFAVIPERRRDDRRSDLEAAGEIRNVFFDELGFARRGELFVIWETIREWADVVTRCRK